MSILSKELAMTEKVIKFKGYQLERTIGTHQISSGYFHSVGFNRDSYNFRQHYRYRFIGIDHESNQFLSMADVKELISSKPDDKQTKHVFSWFHENKHLAKAEKKGATK